MLRATQAQRANVADGTATAETLCTANESIFAQHYAESRNHYAAFRVAYPDACDGRTNPAIYRQACDVLRRPHVIAAIEDIRAQINAQTIVRATDILRDLTDIADANPNELIKLEKLNCRHCHGVDHGYQWRDAAELAKALDVHMRVSAAYQAATTKERKKLQKPGPMPQASGGFGFDMRGDPAPECPHCLGDGFTRVTPMDTTKLSPQARKLYKGVKQKADGSIEILMHDQMAARDMIIKMLGAYKDPKQAAPQQPNDDARLVPEGATIEQAQQTYLALVKG